MPPQQVPKLVPMQVPKQELRVEKQELKVES
jgi:hypothetical protein